MIFFFTLIIQRFKIFSHWMVLQFHGRRMLVITGTRWESLWPLRGRKELDGWEDWVRS